MIIEIERIATAPNTTGEQRQRWRFRFATVYNRVVVSIGDYRCFFRVTTRHGRWVIIEVPNTNYNRHDNSPNRYGNGKSEASVPLPADVKAEALQCYLNRVIWKPR